MYAGAVLALPVFLLFRPKPTNCMLCMRGLLLLLMVPFGYHLLAQNGEIRMLTGQLFAIGLVYYLTLLPADYWHRWREPLAHSVPGYFAAGVVPVLLLQTIVIWGGSRTNAVLSWLGFAGLLLYALLVIVNLLLLAGNVRELLSRRTRSSES